MVKEEIHLQENNDYLTFDLDINGTQNGAQYPLYHVTYAPAKFEFVAFNGFGDAITRKYII